MSGEFGTGKTIFVLAIVVGCFAVLWPKIFYPMLTASVKPPTSGRQVGWQDEANVHFLDQLCYLLEEHQVVATGSSGSSAGSFPSATKWSGEVCLQELRTSCGVQLTEELLSEVRLGKDKSNLTNCLANRYALTPAIVAAAAPPRLKPRPYVPQGAGPHARPERPAHLYPEMMHPALREKGRAMPQRTIDKQARPGPMPGVRPPMGGAGGIVPPPQQKGSGAMGIIMPLYTVGIVVFFVYTIMKVLFKKGQEDDTTPKLKDFGLDPEYRKYVFAEEYLDNADVSTKDQMRRQARDESRSRKKAQQNEEQQQQAQQPETKIEDSGPLKQGKMDTQGKKLGKSECDKISTAISGILSELDEFSSEIEARKQKKIEELASMMEKEKEERKKEEEGAPHPEGIQETIPDTTTEKASSSTDQDVPSANDARSFHPHMHESPTVSSTTGYTLNTNADQCTCADIHIAERMKANSHLHETPICCCTTDYSVNKVADQCTCAEIKIRESMKGNATINTSPTPAPLDSDLELLSSSISKHDTLLTEETISKVLPTQDLASHVLTAEPHLVASCNPNPFAQVFESKATSNQAPFTDTKSKEEIPNSIHITKVSSPDILSKQSSATHDESTHPIASNTPNAQKVTNHVPTSHQSNKQNAFKQNHSTKQSPHPQPTQNQATNIPSNATNIPSNAPNKKCKPSPSSNPTMQPLSAPTNKHKNKRKRNRKRGKKRGGSAWPSSLSINPVVERVEEVGEMTSEEDLTSSEALTTTMSEETSLPTSLQRHLEQIQKNEESPTSSKGSSPDMDEYEVITKDEDHSTATKGKLLRKETATAKSEVKKIQIPVQKPEELEEEEEEIKEEEEEEVEEEVETEEVEVAEEEVHKKGNERQTAESAKTKTKTSTEEMLDEE